MKIEHLVFFPSTAEYHDGKFMGFMPSHYAVCNSRQELNQSLSFGARESDNWEEFQMQELSENQNYL